MYTSRAKAARATYDLYLSFVKILFDMEAEIPTYQQWKADLAEGWDMAY